MTPPLPLARGLAWLILALLVASCAPMGRVPLSASLPAADADALMAHLTDHNRGLVDFKGLGTLRMGGPRGASARVAWAGSRPDRLRIEVLGGGLPVVSVASDGTRFFLRRGSSGAVQSRPGGDSSLAPLLGLPVTVPDILDVLAGRVPAVAHDRVSAHAAAGGVILVLHRRWRGERARIRLDADGDVRQVCVFGFGGGVRYRIAYEGRLEDGGFRVPRRIVLADETHTCTLEVARFWAGVSLAPEAFVLHRPKM